MDDEPIQLFFEKDGVNVHCTVPIGFAEAALGVDIVVPTLESYERLQVPAGTQTGAVLKMPGKGLPLPNGKGRGDQLVRVVVRTPIDLNDQQKRLLRDFSEKERSETKQVLASARVRY